MKRVLILICLIFLIVGCKDGGDSENLLKHDDEPISNEAVTSTDEGIVVPENRGENNLSGEYEVEGKNPDGSVYEGRLEIESKGLYYEVDWEVGAEYHGIGLQSGNILAVGWGVESCNLILYKIREDGHLVGKWSNAPANKGLGSEDAVPETGMKGIQGVYSVTGRNPNESAYEGVVRIKEVGALLEVEWEVGNSFKGVGIQSGELVAVGWGNEADGCAVVLYEIGLDGRLVGRWGISGAAELGNESLKRINK